jgi:CheY-like chemotaxis protein
LGVGLTLVRNLVALHRGTVDASSAGLGRGSEFIVTLPLEEPPAPRSPSSVAGARTTGTNERLRVLIADDDEDGREMLAFLLRGEGHLVEIAEDGKQALRKAETFRPDVALLDLSMPGANGFEVAKALRNRTGGERLTIIAMSGLGQADDKANAIEAGFDQHFTKPVDLGTLMSNVRRREDGTANN